MVPCGLQNIGNTCYLISILQILHITPGARDACSNEFRRRLMSQQPNRVLKAHIETMNDMDVAIRRGTINVPSLAVEAAKSQFPRPQQHDAAEYLSFVLGEMTECSKIFTSKRSTTVRCERCPGSETQMPPNDGYLMVQLMDRQLSNSNNVADAVEMWHRETNDYTTDSLILYGLLSQYTTLLSKFSVQLRKIVFETCSQKFVTGWKIKLERFLKKRCKRFLIKIEKYGKKHYFTFGY